MEFNDLLALAKAAAHAKDGNSIAYSYSCDGKSENFTSDQVNDVLRNELANMRSDYRFYREHKYQIFSLIEQVIDEVLPQKVEQQYMQFADVKVLPQGDKAVFKKRITEASRQRAKGFVTQVGLAGRYETFMLESEQIEVPMSAIGAGVRLGFEEFLDGRYKFSDLVDVITEGMDEYIYREVIKALDASVQNIPAVNKVSGNKFSEAAMDHLLAIADSYGNGRSSIFCTYEFAATMKPAEGWSSNDMKDTLWSKGWLDTYKGHTVVILPQSLRDVTNTMKTIDPSKAYIIPQGTDKPIKLAFEGPTQVRESNDNDDWSTELQTYKKFGIAFFSNYWLCQYENTALKQEVTPAVIA